MQREELLRTPGGLEALVRAQHDPVLEHEAPGAHPAGDLGEEGDVLLVVPLVELGDVLLGDVHGDGAHERPGLGDVVRVAGLGRVNRLVEGVRAAVYEGEAADDALVVVGEGIEEGGEGRFVDGIGGVDVVDGDI